MSKKQKKSSSKLKKIYSDSFNFVKESKNYIYLVLALFVFFGLYGYFSNPPVEMEQQILDLLKQIYEKFSDLNMIETIWAIFANNLTVSFIVLISGILFGIFPLLALISNGFIIGFVARRAVELDGLIVLWKLFPHGIFELPAVLISISLGIKIGFQLFKKGALKNNLKNSLKVFFYIVLPLLIIAAIIEGVLVFLLG